MHEYDKLKIDYNNKLITTIIDKKEVNVSFNNIVKFLELSDEDFNLFFDKYNKDLFDGISLEEFIFSVINFIKKERNYYSFPDFILKRIDSLENNNIIDLQALNQVTEININYLSQVEIDDSINEEILKNIPNNFSLLEKAIYIYIKMCKIFKYDSEFYAVNQKGDAVKKHEDINRIKKLNLTDNQVVCYEFNIIYAKFLSNLGINFHIHQGNIDNFGGGHSSLTFRVDEYLIGADSVTSIFNGDLIRAKLNYSLEGLFCINKNNRTKEKFKNTLQKVYKFIISQENNKVFKEYKESFDEVLLEYRSINSNEVYIDLNEKIDILFSKLKESNLTGMDAFAYLLKLKKMIFLDYELEYNVNITLIRNNEIATDNLEALPSAIITINNFDFNEYNANKYYLFIPNEHLYYISFNELKKKFNNGYYEYIDEEKSKERIPGIECGVKYK